MLLWIDSLAAVILVVGWGIALSCYPRLPEQIPVHFGITGEADGWGGRGMIFLMPVVQLVLGVIVYLSIQAAPHGSKPLPEAAKLPLHLLLLEMEALFAWLTWRIAENAFGRARGLGVWFLPVVLLVVGGTAGWLAMFSKGH